ncbi:helix-turn-helix domain-containing protein [Argonema galeatum]|uniref:helix-turn-helix domain-containing protein n=1 Tax=Argonema galeatum TaxID=2942762 RepID=UPI002011EF23|nr:transcriptional regulator [Argonema galeatum]MCL1468779.1 transcriptional regulator [Argonema galeatum A003/A1]
MTQTTGKTTPGTPSPSDYLSMIAAFPPRPITSEEELDATQKVMDSLIDRGTLTDDERDYLHLLGLLVSEYEEIHYPIDDIFGVALLKALIEDWNLQEKDLIPIFQTESNVSEVLSGKQELTVTHIEKLAEFFHVSPAAFLSKSN